MPKFIITYTDDYGDHYKTLPPIEAETFTKAYIEALVRLPFGIPITDVKEVS